MYTIVTPENVNMIRHTINCDNDVPHLVHPGADNAIHFSFPNQVNERITVFHSKDSVEV
jgi:hypothetical protein